jgi:putative ABC transport system permease protein
MRMLSRRPGITIAAILILAIGIGANTAIFSVLHAVLLHPYPYRNADRLVELFETNPRRGWVQASIAPANYFDWEKQNTVFESTGAFMAGNGGANSKGSGFYNLSLGLGDHAVPVKALPVTGSVFRVLGTQPLLGRAFREEETWAGHNRVAILSYRFWKNAFGGNPEIVGKTIRLNARACTVVGVMPADFYFPSREAELWLSLGLDPADVPNLRRPHFLHAIARLKPGVTIDQARAQMNSIASGLEKQYPDTNTDMGVGLQQMHQYYVSDVRLTLFLLLAAVVFVLLVACANLANLVLAQYSARAKEISVRLALGAGRARLLRQFFIEGLILSCTGGILGLLLAGWCKDALMALSPGSIPRFEETTINLPVALFAGVLSLITPLLFGILPAFETFRQNIVVSLKDAKSTDGIRGRFARNLLLVAEVSLSLLLLFGAGLMMRSLLRLQEVDPGFDSRNVFTFVVSLPAAKYTEDARVIRTFQELHEQLRRLPGVKAVAATAYVPLRDSGWTSDFTIDNSAGGLYGMEVHHKEISPDYFETMKIPLLKGRQFSESDTQKTPRVAIINETMAHRYFGKEDPIGKRVKFDKPQDKGIWRTIVGVVSDEKQDHLRLPADPQIYESFLQSPQSEMSFLLRTAGNPGPLAQSVPRLVRAIDKDVAPYEMTTMEDVVGRSIAQERFISSILGIFAAVGLILAAIGIYGVVSYLSSERTREIGIRMAMGAKRADILHLMLSQGLRPVLIGIVIGVAASLALARLISALLFQVNPGDPVTLVSISILLIVTAVLAGLLPARKACAIDPLKALHYE